MDLIVPPSPPALGITPNNETPTPITMGMGEAVVPMSLEQGSTATEVVMTNPYPKGDKGDTGATGATGPAGQNGKSAYELDVAAGYVGTLAAWLTDLHAQGGNASGISYDNFLYPTVSAALDHLLAGNELQLGYGEGL